MINVQELINDSVKREDKHQPVMHWRASRLGQCLKGVYLERLGKEPDQGFDERTLRVFKVGKMFEDWVIKKITDGMPKEDWDSQIVCDLPYLDASGHPDLIFPKEKIIYELKTVHSKKFWYMTKDGSPDEHYSMQLMFYLLATGYPEGRLLYVSKDDLAIAEYKILADNQELKDKVINELKILNDAWKTKVAPAPEPPIKDGEMNWRAKYCNWHKQCMEDKDWLEKAQKELKNNK